MAVPPSSIPFISQSLSLSYPPAYSPLKAANGTNGTPPAVNVEQPEAGPSSSAATPGPSRSAVVTQDGVAGSLRGIREAGPARPAGTIWEQQLASKKRKWSAMGFGKDEQDQLLEECTSLHLAAALDQEATLYPPPPTSFQSYEDAVQRLVPYHVWQIHDEELDVWEKADEDREAKDAADLVKRIQSLNARFAKARRRENDRPAPLPSTISFLQSSTGVLREDLSSLQSRLRVARIEHNAIEQEQKRKEDERRKERLEEEGRRTVAAMAMRQAQFQQQQQQQQQASKPSAPSNLGQGAQSSFPPSLDASPRRGRGRPPGPTKAPTGQPPLIAAAAAASSNTPGASGTFRTAAAPLPPTIRPPVTNGVTTPVKPGGGGLPQGPVSITVSLTLLPHLFALGLISVPPNTGPNSPRTPGTIVRTLDDKKSVVIQISLGMCSKPQLVGLAKVLNVNTKPATPGASAPSTPSGSGSGGK